MTIPKGYKLVPVEPTEEMLVVMHDRILIGVNSKKREANILNDKAWWAAVVDSAPTPPQPIYDEAKEIGVFTDWFLKESIGCANRKEYQACATLAHAREILRVGWLACAQSRAKALEETP